MSNGHKVALITGAGTGIGKASAKALANAGYALVLAGRRKEPLEAVKKEIEGTGGKAIGFACDVGKPDQVKTLFVETKNTFGRLDVLFNNAGMGAPPVPLEDVPYEKWMEVVAVHLTGVFLCTQEAFKIMKDQTPRGGRMKIMSSLEAAGFEPCSFAVAERIRTNVSARDYLDRGVLTKESTSQLTLLEDKEYEAGITRIRTAVQEAEARGEDLKLRADLCLYATFGTVQR